MNAMTGSLPDATLAAATMPRSRVLGAYLAEARCEVLRYLRNPGPQLLPRLDVHAHGGFVEEQQAWPADERVRGLLRPRRPGYRAAHAGGHRGQR